jgi:hypothetical protein
MPFISDANGAHVEIRAIAELVGNVASKVPALPKRGSPRHQEVASLRSTSGGGGRTRAELLGELSAECHLQIASLLIVADGVADCLELAAQRDNVVNFPVLTIVLRSVLEMAGQAAWLLDDSIGGDDRVRRYVAWQFADLRSRRLMLRDFDPPDDPVALAEIDQQERELLAVCEAARWLAVPTRTHGNGQIEAAALLDSEGRRQGVPSQTQLVRLVASTPSLYGMVSIAAHGARVGARYSLEISDDTDRAGRRTVRQGGFGLPPNLVIQLTALALCDSGRRVAGWNGLDASQLHERACALINRLRDPQQTPDQ